MRRAAVLTVAGAQPAQRRNARTHDGAVEPHGTLTLFWLYGHRHPLAEPARDCLL
jgi:hypothetical protein